MKNNNKENKIKISGSLDKLISRYQKSQVASQIQANLSSTPLQEFSFDDVEVLNIFNLELIDMENIANSEFNNSSKQALPVFLYMDENQRPIVFGGIKDYLIQKENSNTFKGYLTSELSLYEVILYAIEEIKTKFNNSLLLANAINVLKVNHQLSIPEISLLTDFSRPQIVNLISLLTFPDEIKTALIKNEVSYTIIRPMKTLPRDEDKIQLFHRIKEENLNVRQVEEIVRVMKQPNLKSKNCISIDGDTISIKCYDSKEAKRILTKIKSLIK